MNDDLYSRVTRCEAALGLFYNLHQSKLAGADSLAEGASQAVSIATRFQDNLECNKVAIDHAASPVQRAIVELKLLLNIADDLLEHTRDFALNGQNDAKGLTGDVVVDGLTEAMVQTANRCDMLKATLFDLRTRVTGLTQNTHVMLNTLNSPMFLEELSRLNLDIIDEFKRHLSDVEAAIHGLGRSPRGAANERLLAVVDYLSGDVLPEMEALAKIIKNADIKPSVDAGAAEEEIVHGVVTGNHDGIPSVVAILKERQAPPGAIRIAERAPIPLGGAPVIDFTARLAARRAGAGQDGMARGGAGSAGRPNPGQGPDVV